jgi:hypothetical protein
MFVKSQLAFSSTSIQVQLNLKTFPNKTTLLQRLTLIYGTQTGCRRLDSYIEQKKFLACGPEFSVEFFAPPEFSGGVTEKY